MGAAVKRAHAVVKKIVVKAKKVFHKVGKQVKAHAKLMKVKVHVRPKDCKCTPKKKAVHKMKLKLKLGAKKAAKKVVKKKAAKKVVKKKAAKKAAKKVVKKHNFLPPMKK